MFKTSSSFKGSWPQRAKAGVFRSMKGEDILTEKLIDRGPGEVDVDENKLGEYYWLLVEV